MPVPEIRPSEYEIVLRQELAKLQEVLLKQHQSEVARKMDLTYCMAKDDPRGMEYDAGLRMIPMDYQGATLDNQACATQFESGYAGYAKCMQWKSFTLRLLDDEDSSHADGKRAQRAQLAKLEEDLVDEEEELKLRPAWNISWQEASRTHRSRNHMGSVRKSHSLKMNEFLREHTCLGRCVLPPRSKQQMLWTFLGSLFILWDLITIPLEFFQLSDQSGIFTIMGRITMGFWMLDMPMNLFFGVETQGKTEMRILPLARIYFRSYFFLDLLVVSIDVALLLVEFLGEDTSNGGFRSARFLRTMRLLRLLRLLRAVKLQQELTLLANRFLSVHVFMVAKVVMGLTMMLLVNHIIACLWYGIGSWIMFETGTSWLVRSSMADAGFAESYAASMHWTLTQFTPATNDIAPNSALERLFAVWVILLAMGVFSSFISSITATVSSLRASQAKQFQQRASLLRFFCERNLSADLYGKVEDVLRKEGMFRMRVQETEVELIRGIPETLHQQMHEEMFMAMLTQVQVWPSWAHTEDFHFLRTVCHFCMVEHIAKPMQDAFLPGRTCTEVFIIESGRLCYAPGGKGEVEVEEGEVLCLPTLWAEWKYRGRLCASYGAAYYVGISSQKFCDVAAEHGGPLWQYLHILGILLLGSIESLQIRTDLMHPETMLELQERATKYAEIFNSRIGMKGSLNHSKSDCEDSVVSSSFRPVLETMNTFTEIKVAKNEP